MTIRFSFRVFFTFVMFSESGAMNIPGGGSLKTLQMSLKAKKNVEIFNKKQRIVQFYRFILAKHVALGSCVSQSAQWNGSHGFLIIVETSSVAVVVVVVVADAFIDSSSCSTPFNICEIVLAVAAK